MADHALDRRELTAKDDKLARQLADLIGLFFDHIKQHEVPGFVGLKDKPVDEFALWVGVYRRYTDHDLLKVASTKARWRPVTGILSPEDAVDVQAG